MSKKEIRILVFVAGMFLVAGFLILLSYFPRGSYSIERDQVKINVVITENTFGFIDTDFTKSVTLEAGNKVFRFYFWSVELKFSLIKRNRNGEEFWIVDDYMRGMAKVKNGELDFSCFDCSGSRSLHGEDLETFTFENFEWTDKKTTDL